MYVGYKSIVRFTQIPPFDSCFLPLILAACLHGGHFRLTLHDKDKALKKAKKSKNVNDIILQPLRP